MKKVLALWSKVVPTAEWASCEGGKGDIRYNLGHPDIGEDFEHDETNLGGISA